MVAQRAEEIDVCYCHEHEPTTEQSGEVQLASHRRTPDGDRETERTIWIYKTVSPCLAVQGRCLNAIEPSNALSYSTIIESHSDI